MKDLFFLKAVIDRFEGKNAVIKTDDDQELIWPIKKLPEDCYEGSVLRLFLSTNLTEEKEQEERAKNLLNEILKSK